MAHSNLTIQPAASDARPVDIRDSAATRFVSSEAHTQTLESSGCSEPEPEEVQAWIPISARSSLVLIVDAQQHMALLIIVKLEALGFSNFLVSTSTADALQMIRTEQPDVVILNFRASDKSATDLIRSMRMDSAMRQVPVVVSTNDVDDITEAINVGAHDHIHASMAPAQLAVRLRNAIQLKQEIARTQRECGRLEDVVRRRTSELLMSRQQLIVSLARAAEFRDNDTGNHVVRVGRYVAIIAEALGWPADEVDRIEQAAQLHDVGKIAIPDEILFKEGKLDPQEFELMKQHSLLGSSIIEPFSNDEMRTMRSHARLGSRLLREHDSPMMFMAARIALTHHERWDGTGYPLGLKGEDIPIEGRMTAVADVFDALTSARCYKPAFPRERCLEILEEGRGTQFDPTVLDAFIASTDQIVKTQLELADTPPQGVQRVRLPGVRST